MEELAREEEDLMREIATLKKTVPAATARQYADTFWSGLQSDQEAFEAAAAAVKASEEAEDEQEEEQETTKGNKKKTSKEDRALLAGLGQVERREDVEKGYRGVVDTLGRLKREMPATVAKMERARVAGEYVVTER